MDFNLDFNLVRSQKLLLIPQLKLALDLLEMDSRELFDYVENQLETNPALEADTDARLTQEGSDEEDTRMQDDFERSLSLKQHLLIQLNTLHLDKSSLMIGEYLIDNTDDSGYLKVDVPEVAAFFNVPSGRVESVLEKLQYLDPPGICARTLRECLLLQLDQLEDTDDAAIKDDAMKIVEKYLDKIASGDVGTVSSETGLPAERVCEIFSRVKGLEPRPGREFYIDEAQSPAPPDIIIREADGGCQPVFNEEAFPDVCISESFRTGANHMAVNEGDSFVHESVKNAVWLIKCLEQRKNIILDIASRLLSIETEFFKYGSRFLQLLDKSAFAADMDMHESILDKALNGKFLQCRWGTFHYCSFFINGKENQNTGLLSS